MLDQRHQVTADSFRIQLLFCHRAGFAGMNQGVASEGDNHRFPVAPVQITMCSLSCHLVSSHEPYITTTVGLVNQTAGAFMGPIGPISRIQPIGRQRQ